MNVRYEGFFIQEDLQSKLFRDIEYKHVTSEYKPLKTHEELYGQKATFLIVGYGNDSVNEGFQVKLAYCESDELRELFNAIPIPHITLSVSEEGKPVNTANLEFHSIGNPATVTGIFGGFLNKPILTN